MSFRLQLFGQKYKFKTREFIFFKECFPSTAKINLENGNVITMSELQIGDRVKTGRKINFFIYCFKIRHDKIRNDKQINIWVIQYF